YSSEARSKDLSTQKEFRDKLNAIDGSQLTGPSRIDFRILKENIDYEIWSFTSKSAVEIPANPTARWLCSVSCAASVFLAF
ncbi:MAG TPA: hypothetical protein VFX07_09835, partial [Candidatus Udaeobacter sp.]|nr:hypothetical protein [Candidatus Udaeobacter sp.]